MKNKAIILLSGGLDSAVTAFYVKKKLGIKEGLVLFYDYKQRALKEEEYCSRKLAKLLNYDFKKINLHWLGDISTAILNKEDEDFKETTDEDIKDVEKEKEEILGWWVPCRNSIFLLNALAHAESSFISKKEKSIVFIGLKDEGKIPMKDTTPKFLKKVNELAEEATHHGGYELKAPLIDKDKDEIVKLAKELEVPLELTYSCYIENGFKDKIPIHCGKCNNCKQRQAAFHWSNIEDPSIYKDK